MDPLVQVCPISDFHWSDSRFRDFWTQLILVLNNKVRVPMGSRLDFSILVELVRKFLVNCVNFQSEPLPWTDPLFQLNPTLSGPNLMSSVIP